MFRALQKLGVVTVGLVAGAATASADSVYLYGPHDHGVYDVPVYLVPAHPPVYVAPPPPVVVVPVPAAPVYAVPPPLLYPDEVVVYARPADCGAYRYWDGAGCVDARDVPPFGHYK